MIKEIAVHERMITFRMLFWQTNVLIHIKGDDVFKANLARFVHLYQRFIRFKWSTTGWQAQHERTICCRIKRIDTLNDMACCPFANLSWGSQGNQSHHSPHKLIESSFSQIVIRTL